MPLGVNAQVTVNTYDYESKEWFVADRYRYQKYLGDSANTTVNDKEPTNRSSAENTAWTANCVTHLNHYRARHKLW